MGQHRAKLGRRGMAALAAAGALIVGGGAAAMIGTSNAEPLVPLPVPGVGTTYVVPNADGDLPPFVDNGTRGAGALEVSETYGAPLGGGEASLQLTTPGGDDKASIIYRGTPSPLAEWVPTVAYSAFLGEVNPTTPAQFPSLQLEVDFNGAEAGGFSTLTYEPIYNDVSTAPDQWHRYQAGLGDWCSTRAIPGVIPDNQTRCDNGGDKPLSAYLASTGIVVTGVVINQGSGNPGVDAAVDLVSTPSTTYDFELKKPVVVPDPDPCEEPTTPAHPGGGDWGNGHENGNEGHENGHENDGHDNGGGHEQPNDEGHEKPDNGGHEDNGNEGHEQPEDGGHEPPQCAGS